jgi:hypothetical protein
MNCPRCQHPNPDGERYCEICGVDLSGVQITPRAPAPPPPPPPPAVPNPHAKRRTLYDPGPASPPLPQGPLPGADEVFSRSLPPRKALDPNDPFGASAPRATAIGPTTQPPAPQAPPPPPAPRPAAASPRTIVERPAGPMTPSAQVRGALLDPRYGRLHALRVGRNTVGRDPDQDVVVEDGRVSGRHGFLFIKESGEASFMDVSTNGSVVNGAPLHGEVAELAHGAVLKLGGAAMILLLVPPQVLREAGL